MLNSACLFVGCPPCFRGCRPVLSTTEGECRRCHRRFTNRYPSGGVERVPEGMPVWCNKCWHRMRLASEGNEHLIKKLGMRRVVQLAEEYHRSVDVVRAFMDALRADGPFRLI